MADKYQTISQLTTDTTEKLTGSYQEWTAFLTTAARLYKYPFLEQVMIYAQRPEATACADYDVWNRRMRRYIRRGSAGIALIDNSGNRPTLRYVFDITDTGGGENAKRPYLWQYREPHRQAVMEALETRYGVSAADGLDEQLEQTATQLAAQFWDEYRDRILGIVDGSHLKDYDEADIREAFLSAASVSITYSVMSRCGMEPDNYFRHEDFLSIFDFNSMDTIVAFGSAVSSCSESILRQIEVTIKKYEREHSAERTEEHGEQTDLQAQRGLSDSRPDDGRDTGAGPRQVREDAQEVSGRTRPDPVEHIGAAGDVVPAPAGDRGRGEREIRADDAGAGEVSGRDGGAESDRPDALDRPDEHLQGAGGGSDLDGVGVRVEPGQDGEQFSLFPSQAQQMQYIAEAESVVAPSAFGISQEEIDAVLIFGSNTDNARMKLVTEFSKGKTPDELTAFVKQIFHGGYGIQTGYDPVSAWYGEDGIHLAHGRSAEHNSAALVLSWEDAAARIGELLEQGRFATNVELAEAPGNERHLLADAILYAIRDVSEEGREQGWDALYDSVRIRGNGFPEMSEYIAEVLENPEKRKPFVERFRQFVEAWQENPAILRFRFNRPVELLRRLDELELPRREYITDMAELPAVRHFITEDEIDHVFSEEHQNLRQSIYLFWQTNHTAKEKTDFLKEKHGWSGRSSGVSHNFGSWLQYENKGVTLQKPFCGEVQLSWAKVAQRIDKLVADGRYWTLADSIRIRGEQQREEQAQQEPVQTPTPQKPRPEITPEQQNAAVRDYASVKLEHPDDLVLYRVGDFYEMFGEDAEQAAAVLDVSLTTRNIPDIGRVSMCGVPAHNLDFYVEQLRDKYDIAIAGVSEQSGEFTVVTLPSIDHEANRAIDAQEAEYGADGFRAFRDEEQIAATEAERDAAPAPIPSPAPIQQKLTQEDIDESLRTMFPSIEVKRAVVRYMKEHGREKDTAAWLASQYYSATLDNPLQITLPGPDGDLDHAELSWPKVQRRIAQLIKAEKFYTPEEYDRMDDVDPIAIREQLAANGIENGEVVDPDKLNNNAFVRQVTADAEQAAQGEQTEDNHADADAWRYNERQKFLASLDPPLTDDQLAVVQAMEAAGYDYAPALTYEGMRPDVIFLDGNGTPLTFKGWEKLYEWLDTAGLPLSERVRNILHPAPDAGANAPETATTVPEAANDIDRSMQPYKVGNTIYLDGTAFEINAIRDFDVELRDPTLFYPVFRAESKERFETALYQDTRNGFITDYLSRDLNDADSDLQDALTWDGGLLELRDKGLIAGWIRAGEGNAKIAQRLSDTYAGRSDTMTMQTGETLDYFATTTGMEINIQDKYSTKHSFQWIEIAQILRAMYQQERDGFYHDPAIIEPVNLTGAPIYAVGDSVVVPYPDHDITGTIGYIGDVDVRIDTGPYSWSHEVVNRKYFEYAIRHDERNAHLFQPEEKETEHEQAPTDVQGEANSDAPAPTATVYPAVKNGLPYDIVIETIPAPEPVQEVKPEPVQEPTPEPTRPAEPPATENFRITDDHLGEGGPKAKYRMNVEAIRTLKQIELDGRSATAAEQEILSRYVGWGGIPDAFDPDKEKWVDEYRELKSLLTDEEYRSARASTLNAHYTSPTVIKAIYEAVGNMGFTAGNVLEPSCGVGNFFGLLPESMSASKLYGVELDGITGRIVQQLYPKARINVRGYEKTDFPRDFFDLAIGNVPFGQYKVNDPQYNKLGFSIHNYFFAKALDQVRPGGVVAFVTSRYTMDAQDSSARQYLAKRAKLLGAIRLPNNAFRANAGTDVVSDIIFLQKSDSPIVDMPEWTTLGENEDGFSINRYFLDHPEMVLGEPTSESTQYGRQDYTVAPTPDADLAQQLKEAVSRIHGEIKEVETVDLSESEEGPATDSIPADPDVRNFSFTVVDGKVYYRQNSIMVKPDVPASTKDRIRGMVELRDCVHHLIALQMDGSDALEIYKEQQRLSKLYDTYTAKYGLINSRGNSLAFAADSAYYLLCSLEVLDEDGNLVRKGDFFTKRTIKPHTVVTRVDTSSEALAVSIAEKAKVDMPYMMQLTGKTEEEIFSDLKGVIFLNPMHGYAGEIEPKYLPADEYLSGNIREKLEWAQRSAELSPDDYAVNVEALTQALPKELDASEIDVRLGATWVDKRYIQQFMYETFKTPPNLKRLINVSFSSYTAEWSISGKSKPTSWDVMAYTTYGTDRANAYRILEDTLNLRDVRIYDTIKEPDGKERRVLNQKETTLAQQKQQAIKDAFRDWVWRDPERRHELVKKYNEQFNSTRPREYNGQHITFGGINPEITLREHQLNAIAHVLYGGNTLLAHEVGAGKTFEMVAAAMESKRLGLCQKSLFAVPNHLIEQWAAEFLRLYPSANILVATKKDFEKANRKKFCARIATGDYDAIIMGHSQFERLPVSYERRERLLQDQIEEIEEGIREMEDSGAEKFSVKQLERTKRSLEARLEKLHSAPKDDVVTFEQLGVDRLFVDEAHSYKNCFLYTKMRNVAGLSTSDAQKSSDMLLKCRYLDEITGGKGIVFATGTPVSNSMTELYTMQRYLQQDLLRRKDLSHFDNWASIFGETVTAIELAPEGTGYRARTRFARFFNLPELMTMFKETADIKTADQLNLPTPEVEYHVEKAEPTEQQKALVKELSDRAAVVHTGRVDPKVDNMLKITNDGRKLGLDQRLINPNFPDDPGSKLNMCVSNILQIWRDGQADKLTQLVFCDLSVPKAKASATKDKTAMAAGDKTAGGAELHALDNLLGLTPDAPFSVYEDIRDKLIAGGIPPEQIAFIHDANTEAKKKELFAKVRAGQVRVLMGSTFKMGAGMNVQDRLVALHDLDCPWRPGDLEQRKGRIVRQGNQNKTVHVYRYVTNGTFDSYLWQTVENKQKFISQIMTSKSPVRSCEDVDETALSYAEIKALCAGNPLIREKMDLDIDVARLKLLKADHQSKQFRLEDDLLKRFPEQIKQTEGFIAGFEADIKTAAEHQHPKDGFAGLTIRGDTLTDKDNAGAALLAACKEIVSSDPVEIGSYRGFSVSLSVENFGHDYILTMKGQMQHRITLGRDPKGNFVRMDNALAGIPDRLLSANTGLENLQKQMAEAKAELGKPFPQEDELREKSARLDMLNIQLNIDSGPEHGEEQIAKSERPSVLDKLSAPLPVRRTADVEKTKRHEQER